MSEKVKTYLKLLAQEHIDNLNEDGTPDEYWKCKEARDEVWEQMEQEEKNLTNELVEGIFGDWL